MKIKNVLRRIQLKIKRAKTRSHFDVRTLRLSCFVNWINVFDEIPGIFINFRPKLGKWSGEKSQKHIKIIAIMHNKFSFFQYHFSSDSSEITIKYFFLLLRRRRQSQTFHTTFSSSNHHSQSAFMSQNILCNGNIRNFHLLLSFSKALLLKNDVENFNLSRSPPSVAFFLGLLLSFFFKMPIFTLVFYAR